MTLDPASVDEYTTRPVEKIKPYSRGECARASVAFREQDFDLDPDWGIDRHMREKYTHGHGVHRCLVCCNAAMTARSDHGYWDFTILDDEEPEWVGLCWECAKPIIEGERG